MKKQIIILVALILSLSSCDQREIQTYNSGNYVSFTSELKDTTIFTFLYYVEDVVKHPIKLKLIGDLLGKDTEFKITVDPKVTTLDSKLYEVPETFIFPAGKTEETVYVTLTNASHLKENEYLLVLDIVDHNEMMSAKGRFGRKAIKVSDLAKKPDWWTERPIERYYLGKYSRKKLELFIEVTGVGDLTNMPLGEVRILTLKFQHWLDKQEPKIYDEENEQVMQTNIIG